MSTHNSTQYHTQSSSHKHEHKHNKKQQQHSQQLAQHITLTHTSKLGAKQFQTFLQSQPSLSTIIFSIQKYLQSYQLNYKFYYTSILQYIKGRDLDTTKTMLQQQYKKMVSGRSFLHLINNAVFSRSKCMQKIKRDLTKVQAVLQLFTKCYFRRNNQQNNVYLQYTVNQGYSVKQIDTTIQASIKLISSLFIDLSRLRDMTIYIVQTVHKWKVQREQWLDRCKSHKRIDFYIKRQLNQDQQQQNQDQLLYEIIRTDTDFIWVSKLSEYIWLQHKNDPLLIRNVVNVSQRQTKQILQKYFLQILYPNSQQLIDKIIKVVDMLNFQYKPMEINLYEEEQKLIENYLSLRQKEVDEIGFQEQHQQSDARQIQLLNTGKGSRVKQGVRSRIVKSQSQSKITTVRNQFRSQIDNDFKQWQSPNAQYMTDSPYSNKSSNSPEKQSPRGWTFGKQLKKPSTDRIRDIIKKHQVQMVYLKNHKGMIKPMNIINLPQKKSIALAYLSEKNAQTMKLRQDTWIIRKQQEQYKSLKLGANKKQQIHSDGEQIIKRAKQQNGLEDKRKLYQSLVRVHSVIQQDPKEHEMDQQTPKNRPHNREHNKQVIKNRFFLQKPQKSQQSQSNKDLSKTIDKKDVQKQKQAAEQKPMSRRDSATKKPVIDSRIKVNTHIFNNLKQEQGLKHQQLQEAEIQVDQQETPLNFKQFFEVFRADTTSNNYTKGQTQSRVTDQMTKSNIKKEEIKQLGGSIAIRKAIDRRRAQSLKNTNLALLPYYSHKKKKPTLKKGEKSLNKSKDNSKAENSFQNYKNVALNTSVSHPKQQQISSLIKIQTRKYLTLRPKQITKDLVSKYVRHLCSSLPISCQSFTNYHTMAYQGRLIQLLQDSTMNSIIFDIEDGKQGKIGQAIIVESLSSTMKMRYTVEFVNVGKFQALVNSICRIAEELLATSPCEQVVLKLTQDKADPVSAHFIALLDTHLHKQSQNFSYFHILQKQVLGLTHQNLHEHVYFFQSKSKNLIKEHLNEKFRNQFKVDNTNVDNDESKNNIRSQVQRKRVPGSSYRSLVFQTKCVALTSNFKLRSENLNKAMVQIYKDEAIGLLYVMLLEKIMTKYHLKQLKIASLSLNDSDQTTGLIKKSPFLRSIFFSLLESIKKTSAKTKSSQLPLYLKSAITKFTNMTDLLNYLSYKEYDQNFKFDFLTQSRFILNHQLTLSEINLSASLDFVLQNGVNIILLNNHHGYVIQEIVRMVGGAAGGSTVESGGVSGYLLPTTQDYLKIFFISAKQYLNCSDSLDLFSYLQLLFKESILRQNHNIDQIAIPDLTKRKQKINQVKMYDGFLRLFPERQFYSASMLRVQNLWENYYPSAVISRPKIGAPVMEYPLIVGFYDCVIEMPVVAYLLKQQKEK